MWISHWNTVLFGQAESKKKIDDADQKIPNTSGLMKKTDYNTKVAELENKIPSVTGLAPDAPLNTKATSKD